MSITYVSALYSLYGDGDVAGNVARRLMRDVGTLLQAQLPLILFVDDVFAPLIAALTVPECVRVVPLPMHELTIYHMIVANKTLVGLPPQRDRPKDTHEYIALMNSKIEFLQRALPYVTTPHVAWIDAGVAKMIKKPETFDRLRAATCQPIETTLFPGCYQRTVSFGELQRQVWWVFIGTFFVVNTQYVSTFYNLSLQSLARFFLNGIVPWEVNVWIEMQSHNPEAFNWYYSDHDDGLVPPQ
jgi:hypothetical protein